MTARRIRVDHATHEVELEFGSPVGAFTLREGERKVVGARRWLGARLEVEVDGRTREAHVVRGPRGGIELWLDGERHIVEEVRGNAGGAAAGDEAEDEVTAPMPAKIVRVLVAAGDAVTTGQTLVVLESMKMELSVTAPRDGAVRRVSAEVVPGAIVAAGTTLVELEPVPAP